MSGENSRSSKPKHRGKNAGQGEHADAPSQLEARDYEVGYKKPPKQNQFQPGRSGNPKGRPKESQNISTVVREVLQEKIPLPEGSSRREITKLRALVESNLNKAIAGNGKSLQFIHNLMRHTNMISEVAMEMEVIDLKKSEALALKFLQRNGIVDQ